MLKLIRYLPAFFLLFLYAHGSHATNAAEYEIKITITQNEKTHEIRLHAVADFPVSVNNDANFPAGLFDTKDGDIQGTMMIEETDEGPNLRYMLIYSSVSPYGDAISTFCGGSSETCVKILPKPRAINGSVNAEGKHEILKDTKMNVIIRIDVRKMTGI